MTVLGHSRTRRQRGSAATAALAAFAALLARDLTVLRRQPADFLTRTIVQPVLFVFVLGYIAPGSGSPQRAAPPRQRPPCWPGCSRS